MQQLKGKKDLTAFLDNLKIANIFIVTYKYYAEKINGTSYPNKEYSQIYCNQYDTSKQV